MTRTLPVILAIAFLSAGAGVAGAQTAVTTPSPTLPSDTLEANYGPRSAPGPDPELAPSLPSDTLEATQPVDSFPTDPFGADSLSPSDGPQSSLRAPEDGATVRQLQSWIQRHPEWQGPPPSRAILARS